MKTLSQLFVSLSVFALSVSPAYASAVARNLNISNSSADVSATEDVSGTLTIFNPVTDSDLVFDVWGNTGGNDVSGGGYIGTGPAGALTIGANGVNSTNFLVGVDVGGQTLAENNTILDDSDVSATAEKTAALQINSTNWAEMVVNWVNGGANSGENTANGGLFGGDGGVIYTGAAGFGALSTVNANSSFFDVFADMSGNTTARNYNVVDSTANAAASSAVDVAVTNLNMAFGVGNIVNGWANSGNNEANGGWIFGGDGGVISTGPALLGLDAATTVNQNGTVMEVALGGNTKAENVGLSNSYAEANADATAGVSVINNNGAFLVGNVIGDGLFNPLGYAYANSGDNEANGGEEGGDGGVVLTGLAGAAVFADTTANTNGTAVVGDVGGSTTARNVGVTDAYDSAYANADSNANVSVVNDNLALGGNLISTGANSGGNEANGGYEGDGGLISTGAAGALVGSSLALNDNTTLVAGSFGGNATAENIGIVNSYAYAGANQESDGTSVSVLNDNSAFAVNSIEANANSGENSANGGEEWGNGGIVYTGEALLLVEADTTVNTSQTAILGDFGGNATAQNIGVSNGDVDGLVLDGYDAEAYADSSSSVTVINDNGGFGFSSLVEPTEVQTSVLANANTGFNNVSSEDGDGGYVYSGNASLITDVGTTVNSTTTAVVGAGGGNATASNGGISDASVNASATSNGSTSVLNANAAQVDTQVDASANTGNNQATGGGEGSGGVISTGAAVNETVVSSNVNTTDTTVVVKAGNATATNTGVSGGSANATAQSNTTTTVETTNTANVTNNITTSSNTGGNTAASGGVVSTGGAVNVTGGSNTVNSTTGTLVIGN